MLHAGAEVRQVVAAVGLDGDLGRPGVAERGDHRGDGRDLGLLVDLERDRAAVDR